MIYQTSGYFLSSVGFGSVPEVGLFCTFEVKCGSVKDQILDIEYLAVRLLDTLRPAYTGAIAERYRLETEQVADMEAYELLEAIGRKRGMLVAGGEVNTERAAIMLLDEFRSGTLGRMTLERVPG